MSKKTTYKKDFCLKLVEHCKKGYDISSFGATIGVARSTVYEWIHAYPDFKLAHEVGISYLQMSVIDRLNNMADGKIRGNDKVAIFLARVYNIRDDVPVEPEQDPKKSKNVITIAYNLDDKPKQLEEETE